MLLVRTRPADYIRASSQSGCTKRPYTWLHPTPSLRCQNSSCNAGAVHTWHFLILARSTCYSCTPKADQRTASPFLWTSVQNSGDRNPHEVGGLLLGQALQTPGMAHTRSSSSRPGPRHGNANAPRVREDLGALTHSPHKWVGSGGGEADPNNLKPRLQIFTFP